MTSENAESGAMQGGRDRLEMMFDTAVDAGVGAIVERLVAMFLGSLLER